MTNGLKPPALNWNGTSRAVAPPSQASGADANEVIEDLRRHVERK